MCHNKNELRSAIARYRKLQSQKASIDAELAEIKAQIFDYLEYNEIQPKEKVVGPNYTLSYSCCITRNFDTSKLHEVLGEDLSPYQKQSSYNRLYIH